MEFDLHSNEFMVDAENVSFDWSFANDSLSDITEIASAESLLVPLPDSIGQVNCEVTEFCPFATPLPVEHFFVPNYWVPWHHVTDEISPTDTNSTGTVYSNFCSVHDPNNQILEAFPLNPVPILPDAMDTGKSAKNEAVFTQDICLGETNTNFDQKVVNLAEETVTMERRETGRERLAHIGYSEIKQYFYMPITQAAKEMKVGLTILKKRCRELGIPRWPHRKMKSLRSLIRNVQELGKSPTVRDMTNELEALGRLMEENPETQLTEKTKKLRQACFKASYKKRRSKLMYYQPTF